MHTVARSQSTDDTRIILRRLAGGAFVLCLFSVAERAAQVDTMPRGPRGVIEPVAFWLFWALLSVPALFLIRAINQRRSIIVRALGHVMTATVLMLLHSAAGYVVQRYARLTDLEYPIWWGAFLLTRWRLTANLLAYVAIVGVIRFSNAERLAQERQRASARLAGQLSAARLEALRLQLNPHFLFNSLNTVAMLVRRGAASDAVRAVTRLAELLRELLRETGTPFVSLREELALLDRYVDLERLRFGDRLHVVHDIDHTLLDVSVPPFLLQPIVENAIRHGISRVVAGGTLRISARRAGLRLEIEIANDGPGVESTTDTPSGVGLANTVSRLSELYGAAFDLEIQTVPGGVVARIAIPVMLSHMAGHVAVVPTLRSAS